MSGKAKRVKMPRASGWLTGGGEMGKLIREMDWSKTPLGPIESWPQSLRTTVSLCLASNFPISIAWGPQRTQIYNDGYWPICCAKHPHSMGQDFRERWFSVWPAIGEAFERASAGETSFLVNQRMFSDRNGYSVDLSQEAPTSWPLAEVARTGQLEEVNDLERRFGAFSCGPYPEPPKTAYALPIILPGLEQTFGALVAGVSSRRALDYAYRTFYRMLSDSVSNALANARAYEEERKRAEALAELDRAKTIFVSNISHEFRTPLTLMFGTLEDTLAEDSLPSQARDRLDVARRNSLRLLKLVNSLLDLSRIEAGRIQAVYEPVDLAKFTADLASVLGLRGEVYVEEALGWLPNALWAVRPEDGFADQPLKDLREDISGNRPQAGQPTAQRILLADNNADIREYVRRLLGGQYEVEAVADGEAALNAVRERSPDLVLADVMMPKLDGIGLLRELRADERLKTIPVILLSACAGEEARVEGIEAGADDYLVKPFSARELLARVEAHLKLHRVRREAERAVRESERRFREMIDALPAAIYTTDPEGRLTHFNPAAVELSGRIPELGTDRWRLSWKLYYPDGSPMPLDEYPMAVALKEGRDVRGEEVIAERPDGARIWFEPYPTLLRDGQGRIVGGINMLVDITERKRAEDKLAQASQRLQAHIDNSPLAVVQFDPEFRVTAWSEGAERMFGWSAAETLGKRIKDMRWVHQDDAEGVDALCMDMLASQRLRFNHVNRNYRKDGSVIECEWYNSVLRDADGKMVSLSSQVLDITERRRAEMNLAFLAEISHDLARLTGVNEIMRTVGAKIGEYLDLSLCAFVEINEAADEAAVTNDWHRDDAPGLVGVYRIGDFVTSEFQEASHAGELFVVRDMAADPRANAGKFAALNAGSFVGAPLVRDGQWRFLLVAFHSTAHDWRDDEIELIRELPTRIWTQLERVRAQEALRRSEERYRATFDNAAVGIAHVGVDGRWLRFNDAVCAITGYAREELVTKTFPDITHPDDLDADWAQARQVLAGEIPTYSMEKRYLRKDGSIAWVCLTVSLLRDAAGAPQNFISIIEDIGERKLAEEALRESEERFRAIVSQATAGIVETDPTGQFIFANQRYCEITGYSESELRRLRMRDITHPDDLKANAAQLQRLAEGGPDFVLEKRYIRKDGGEVWVNDSVSAVRDAAGLVRSIVAVTLDITKRRQAEMALAEALALNRTITDNTQSCLWMMDTQGRGTFANPASERVSGFKPEELIGQVLHEKVHHTHPDGTPFPIEECPLDNALPLQEAVVGYEDVFVHKDGHFYPVRCAGRPIIVNGEPIGTVIEVQDITEERRATAERERLLEEERRHAQSLQELNATSVAINAATSVEEVVRLINEKARELTGARVAIVNLIHDGDWKRSRKVASLSGEYAAWVDHDAQVTGEGISSLVAREKRTMRMTQAELESHPAWRGYGAEAGRPPQLRGWMAAPLLDGGGESIGVVQLSDKWVDGEAGEFTKADEALLWQLAQVASVALENQQLYEQEQEARQMAEQATRAKDEFLAVVSHELRSPLNAILGWNRLLRSQRGDDSQIAKVTETVERSGKAQLRLIEDLLDTARIISGKMTLETQPVELVAVIAAALDAVRPAADSKGIVIVPDFTHEADQTSYQITGDPDRLQQVVWNMLSNAIKFTPEGGRVWVELRRRGPGVQIIVRDTGQGISPVLLPYVFDRFKQGDSSVSRRFGGLGLGLALVKHLVELHGGSVMVESPGEGQGATFTVSLPVRAVKGDVEVKSRAELETVVARSALHGSQPASLSGVRALVVEDEAGARELITLTLEQHGTLVTGVDSAAAALSALESQLEEGAARAPFDVLISDIGMPGADGYELIRRVRSHADERVSGIRAVALTAYARSEDRLQALRAGFQMHVPKPVDEAELTTVIAALIGRNR